MKKNKEIFKKYSKKCYCSDQFLNYRENVGAGLVPARFSKKSKKSGRAQGPPLQTFVINIKDILV